MRYPRTILASACIPWKEDLSFDKDVFSRQLELLAERGIKNVYIFGTAGEGYAVSDTQFAEITRAFISTSASLGIVPMVGIISLSMSTIKDRIAFSKTLGAREFQISFPSWGELSDDEAALFLEQILDGNPDCSFMQYNLPRARKVLSVKDYDALAEKHKNLVAVKYMNPDVAVEISKSRCPLRFFVGETAFGEIGSISECSLLISHAYPNIRRAWMFFESVIRNDQAAVRDHLNGFACVNAALRKHGPASGIDGAYDKIFCKLIDPGFPLRLLPPYRGCSQKEFEAVDEYMRRECPEWLESP